MDFSVMDEPKMSNLWDNLQVPLLDVGSRKGDTNYIDYIRMSEMTSPIMKGIDYLIRPFIIFKFIVKGEIRYQIIFQRYSNNENYWMSGGPSESALLYTSGITITQYEFLNTLFTNKHHIISSTIFPEREFDIGRNIEIYDEDRWNASKIIQRNWRKCRYNPIYSMCERVTMRHQQEIEEEYGITLVNKNE